MMQWLASNAWWLLPACMVGLLILIMPDAEDCPRSIRGYNCKGRLCDHSPDEVHQARRDMGIWY